MSWHLLSRDEQILVSSLFIVVAAFGLTFSAEINGRFQPTTGQLIEPCGDGFCSADEYSSQTCSIDCPSPPPSPPAGSTGICDCLDANVIAQALSDPSYYNLVMTQCGATILPPACGTSSPSPGPVCGNALCEAAEDATYCPSDCLPSPSPTPTLPPGYCGDTICESWEAGVCLTDCSYSPPPTSCGNSICETGEDSLVCPSDCGSPSPPPSTCGNGLCEAEDPVSCPSDCGTAGGPDEGGGTV